MAIRNIVKLGDPVLRKTARSVLEFNSRIATLVEDMLETRYAAEGVGLAGPQVGVLKRVCVVDIGDGPIELINPVILEKKGEQQESEGCLSLPGRYDVTSRPMWVKVRAQDRFGKTFTVTGEGLLARAFCHEIVHLDGILFIDRLEK